MARKVKMRNMRDGQVYEFDPGPANKYLHEAINSGDWQQELSPFQSTVKMGADMMPPVLGTLGTVAGATGGAITGGAPTFGAGTVPGGVGGGFMGGALGGGMGQMGKEALYGLAGIEMDPNPMHRAARIAQESATGGLLGTLQGLGQVARPEAAQSVMRSAIRTEAAPGVEETLLSRGLTMTRQGMKKAQQLMDGLRNEKMALIDAHEQQGTKWTWKMLGGVLNRRVSELRTADAIGTADEHAFEQAMKVLRSKFGRTLAPRHATTVADPMALGNVNLGRRAVVSPATDITPTMLERIRVFADNQVTGYEKMRLSKNVETPAPMEQAYRMIADQARSMLNRLADPATGRTLETVNDEISSLANAHKAIGQTLSRGGVGGQDMVSAGVGAATPLAVGLMSHDPMRGAGLAIPGAALGYATSNPALRSALALNLNNPSIGRGLLTQAPGQAAALFARLSGMGDPTARAGAFGTAKPDGSQ